MSSFVYMFAILMSSSHAHIGCGTDHMEHKVSRNMKIKPIRHQHSNLEGRAQDPDSSGIFNNIRIHADTTQLENDWEGNAKLPFFIDDVIPAAYEWIQKVFKVRPVDGPLTFDLCNDGTGSTWSSGENAGKCKTPSPDWQQCGDAGALIPEYMFDAEEICASNNGACDSSQYPQGEGLDADLVIYFTGNPALDGTSRCKDIMGFATYCHENSRGRPIAGMVNLCKNTLNTYTLSWEEVLTVIIHETFHSMGFIDPAFDKFLNDDDTLRTDVYKLVTVRGADRAVITLPTVIEKAKAFFNCDSIDGIELEDHTADGPKDHTNGIDLSSHWEARIVINDVMISFTPAVAVYGTFTLALFQDSGWYDINWQYAQEPPYGRNAGCDWYTKKCITEGTVINDVFCTEEVLASCNVGKIGIFGCKVGTWYPGDVPSHHTYFNDGVTGGEDEWADYCPVYKLWTNGDCRLWSDMHEGSNPEVIDGIGSLISGTSKCVKLHGELNGEQNGCYPIHCVRNDVGEYVGARMTHYRNYLLTLFDVRTCWNDETGDDKTFVFDAKTGEDYGFDKFYCPKLDDICYDSNPWICNGHGSIVDGSCMCGPGYFGIDCTIENTKVNRNTYDSTSSVSVYNEKVCNETSYTYDNESDKNVGVLRVDIKNIDSGLYVEEYFRDALRNFAAILMDIPLCHVELRDFLYGGDAVSNTLLEDSITADIYYYTTDIAWSEITDDPLTVFGKLFTSVSYSNVKVDEHAKAEGEHPDNEVNVATNIHICRVLYVVWFVVMVIICI